MATSRRRLPSRGEALLLGGACVALIHVWAVLNFLREVPALLLRMTYSELLAAGAYTLVFALLESVLLFLALVLLAVLLPASWLREGFAVRGVLVLCVLLAWLFLSPRLQNQPPWASVLLLAVLLVALGLSYKLLRNQQGLAHTIRDLLERLSLLSGLYLALDLLSLLLVLARNL